MTKEERNNKLKKFITCMKCEVSGKRCDENCPIQYDAGNMGEIIENLEEISKILEQEPCEDAISRKSMLDYLKYLHGEMPEEEFIKELPSVTPTRKKGHWIDHSDEGFVECYECGSATNCDGNIADLHFCFNCGAEMEEDGRTLKYSDQDTMMQAT